jgi:hypothetical protein
MRKDVRDKLLKIVRHREDCLVGLIDKIVNGESWAKADDAQAIAWLIGELAGYHHTDMTEIAAATDFYLRKKK